MLTTEAECFASVDGKPTFYDPGRTLTQSGFSVKQTDFRVPLFNNHHSGKTAHKLPMTVASSSGRPSAGRPNQPKIKIGSRIRFVSDAAESVKIKRCAFSLAKPVKDPIHLNRRDHTECKYWMPVRCDSHCRPTFKIGSGKCDT